MNLMKWFKLRYKIPMQNWKFLWLNHLIELVMSPLNKQQIKLLVITLKKEKYREKINLINSQVCTQKLHK